MKFLLALLFITTIAFGVYAQDSTTANLKSARVELSDMNNAVLNPVQNKMIDRELYLTLGLLVFGFGIIIVESIIILRISKTHKTGPNVTKLIGVTLIIMSALVLITSGFEAQEVAPIVGLLGTVAGYLLGKSSEATPTTPPKPN